jgi:diguanylate cyclase (GGDEF)-like protein/PAS domain S-box-containing protein
MSLPPAIAVMAAAVSASIVGMLGSARRRRDRAVQDAVVQLATAPDREAVAAAVSRAVGRLVRSGSRPSIQLAAPARAEQAIAGEDRPTGLVPVYAKSGGAQLGALFVDPATARRHDLRPALQVVSSQAALALDRIRLSDLAARRGEPDLANIVEQSTDVVLIVDGQDRITFASPSARTLFGASLLDGTPLLDLVDPAEQRMAGFLLRHARVGHAESASGGGRADWTINGRDGRRVQVEVACRLLRGDQSLSSLVVTLRDVTTLRRLERELTRRVFHDPLTGLPNRLSFGERVGQALATQTTDTAVLLIDIDDFRSINEGLGQEIGDTVLTVVGHRIHETIGHDGVAARLGDDEFAVLIRDVLAPGPDKAAARFAEALADPIPVAKGSVSCTVSVGVATSATASGAPELLRQANLALRAAKAAGRGQRRRYDPVMADDLTDRVALRAALGRAVHDDSLTIDYQPIMALQTGSVVGFEALLRWRHPARGRLHPPEFMDVAEESGLIVPIGERVLRTAMNAARQWPGAPYVSVNVSAHQFRSSGFVRTVQRLLAASGLPPDRLVLELTETLLLRDDDQVWDDLQQLRASGVRVAIDDFGTGYSALSYLRHAPLDLVKLDRLFIKPLTGSARQRELVAGIVRLARILNLEVVAEGIETVHQRDITAQIGCAYGQGHLFGRPVPDPQIYYPPPTDRR